MEENNLTTSGGEPTINEISAPVPVSATTPTTTTPASDADEFTNPARALKRLVDTLEKAEHVRFFAAASNSAVLAGTPCVQMRDNESALYTTFPLESQAFQDLLTVEYMKASKMVPSPRDISNLTTAMGSLIRKTYPKRAIFKRFTYEYEGNKPSRMLYNLGEGKIVEVTSKGWKVIDESQIPNISFIWPAGAAVQHTPQVAGSISDFNNSNSKRNPLDLIWDYVAIKEERDRILYLAFILGCFMPKGPYWLLQLTGPHGASKSSASSFIGKIVDPTDRLRTVAPKSTRDLAILAKWNHLVVLDNLSYVNQDMSNLMCQIATGATWSERTLRTNSELHSYRLSGPQVVNGLSNVITQSDLRDRMIDIELPILNIRRTEADLEESLERDLPFILGEIFNIIAVGMNNFRSTHFPTNRYRQPRMLDQTIWVMACEPAVFNWKPNAFVSTYCESIEQTKLTKVIDTPFTKLLYDLMLDEAEVESPREGVRTKVLIETPQGLFAKLIERASYDYPGCTPEKPPQWFPKIASNLGRKLRELSLDLQAVGIEVEMKPHPWVRKEDPRKRKERWITLTMTVKEDEEEEREEQENENEIAVEAEPEVLQQRLSVEFNKTDFTK